MPTSDIWGIAANVPAYANEGFLSTKQMRPGAVKFKDQITEDTDGDGVLDSGDGVIDEKDKVILGNTVPVLTGGFNIAAQIGGNKWGRFDLSANFTFAWGNKILNLSNMEYTTLTEKSKMRNLASSVNFANRYSLFGEDGTYLPTLADNYLNGLPLVVGDNYQAFAQMLDQANADKGANQASPIMSHYIVTDKHMEDGSFLRLQNLTIGYTLPKVWLDKAHIEQIRVFVQGTNLFCVTKYSGLDPEVDTRSSKNPLTPGVDFSAYPKSRGINVGLNIQF